MISLCQSLNVDDNGRTRSKIPNLNTNDAGQLSLSEYAVLGIAPELAPNSFGPAPFGLHSDLWDGSTTAGDQDEDSSKESKKRARSVSWRSLICWK